MRQKLITLCPTTWELASKKPNFSAWIRDQLRSERNKKDAWMSLSDEELHVSNRMNRISRIDDSLEVAQIDSRELLWHLEQRSPDEIRALIGILKNGIE